MLVARDVVVVVVAVEKNLWGIHLISSPLEEI